MKTSTAGLDLIKHFEGSRLEAYRCSAGRWTIGYGHTSEAGPPAVDPGMRITQAEADEILRQDVKRFEREIARLVTVPLAQHQFDALVCWSFNTGSLARSTLLKRLNRGEYERVPAEIMKWTRAGGQELPGLVRRRRAETQLWRGNDAPDHPTQSRVTPDKPEPSKTILESKEANTALAAGGISAVTAVADIADKAQSVSDALRNPTFVALVFVCIAAAAIWYWRNERLKEEGH